MSFSIVDNTLFINDFNEPIPRELQNKVEKVIIKNGIKSIPCAYFKKIKNIKSVSLPNTLETIENEAFKGCASLTQINLHNVQFIGDEAFVGANLESIVLTNARELGKGAFSICQNLKNVELGNRLLSISEDCFLSSHLLKTINLPKSVKTIGDQAFQNSGVQSINLEGVEKIGIRAFSQCKDLKTVELADAVKLQAEAFKASGLVYLELNIEDIPTGCFANCTHLENIKLSNTKYIRFSAFENSGLKELNLPNTVVSLGNEICRGCRGLKSIHIPCKEIPIGAFMDCPALTKVTGNVEQIFDFAFQNCGALIGLDLPNLKIINRQAFMNCATLRYVDFDKLRNIGVGAFSGCKNLGKGDIIDLSNCKLGDECFKDCWGINGVVLPANDVPMSIFKDCKSLEFVKMPEGVGEIGSSAFSGCQKLTNIHLPSTVYLMGNSVFMACYKLSQINIPDNVREIPQYAFSHCESLESISLPENLQSILCGAFYQSGIKEVELPPYLSSIEFWAFYGCKNLQSIDIPQVESLADTAFCECDNLKEIKLPIKIRLNDVNSDKDVSYLSESFYKNSNVKSLILYDEKNEYKFNINDNEKFKDVFPISCSGEIYLCATTNHAVYIKSKNFEKVISNEQIQKYEHSNLIIGDVIGLDAMHMAKRLKNFLRYEIYLQKCNIPSKSDDIIISQALQEKQYPQFLEYREYWQKALNKYIPQEFNDKLTYFNLCYALGLFMSDEKHRINVLNFLNKDFVNDEFITPSNIGDKLDGIKLKDMPNIKLLNFFKQYYKQLEKDNNASTLVYAINNFDEISKMLPRVTADDLKKYMSEGSYSNIEKGSEMLARLASVAGYNQYQFETLQQLFKQSQQQPSNIFERIESRQAQIQAQEVRVAKELLDTVDDEFTFEWLDKHSEYNLLLGEICKCCAKIGAPGAGIMQASAIDKHVQNLVVREKGGDYIGKATIYVNPRRQYAVINNFIVKEKYRKGERAQGVFDAFMRGIKAFVAEYNSNNEEAPLLDVTVGMANNKLERLVKQNLKKSAILYQGANFVGYPGDGVREQYVVYSASQNMNVEK